LSEWADGEDGVYAPGCPDEVVETGTWLSVLGSKIGSEIDVLQIDWNICPGTYVKYLWLTYGQSISGLHMPVFLAGITSALGILNKPATEKAFLLPLRMGKPRLSSLSRGKLGL
jgi:hypothetical protein